MNVAQSVSLADSWGMHSGGWWILGAVVMMLFMGAMMWMMMRGMGSKRSSTSSDSPRTTESAVEVLERRFAEGKISVEDYRERRETLTGGAPGERAGVSAAERRAPPDATGEEES